MSAVRLLILATLAGCFFVVLRYVPFELPSYGFYAALIVAILAAAALFRPLPSVWLSNRRVAGAVLAGAIVLAGTMLMWPITRQRPPMSGLLLDQYLPDYDFREFHSLAVAAPAEQAWRAVKEVTFADVPAFRNLMRIRLAAVGRFRPSEPEQSEPILASVTRAGGGFTVLEERAGSEVVLGMVGRPWKTERRGELKGAADFAQYSEPNAVRIVFNLKVSTEGSGSRISTETRIAGVDEAGSRAFRLYWRAVYPGSSILRVAWLEAIARRAARR